MDIERASLRLIDADGNESVILDIYEHGGRVEVIDKGEGAAVMEFSEYGNGAESAWEKTAFDSKGVIAWHGSLMNQTESFIFQVTHKSP